ncbi:FIG01202762: hypothetical protein [Vibrio cholerae]|nr:hypothetical protein VIF_002962 [Vibrio cholerae TM 11079-80]EJH53048.1 hypothetical protein VCHC43B1_1846 [Vibrio cholerae HC-43B1]EKK97824.1 hypothetical protein VCCP1035_1609 [Vibrio cholerae CP1035(8)]CQB49579.1 FIG01202762: hypothetical protein [Vibrio cholerae]
MRVQAWALCKGPKASVMAKVLSTVFIVVYGFMCFIFISDSSLVM